MKMIKRVQRAEKQEKQSGRSATRPSWRGEEQTCNPCKGAQLVLRSFLHLSARLCLDLCGTVSPCMSLLVALWGPCKTAEQY